MSNRLYTLIAHKSESSDYCRGCHMASYSGDHEAYVNLSVEELTDKMAALQSRELQINETGYDFAVLTVVDGYITRIFGDLYVESGAAEVPESVLEQSDDFDKEVGEIVNLLEAKTKAIVDAREKQRADEKAAETAETAARQRARELTQLKELQDKYAGQV